MADLLVLEGLNAWYGARQVLHDVQVRVPAQGCTVLLGPCGTGKSTVLRCLRVFGQSAAHESREGAWQARCRSAGAVQPLSVGVAGQKTPRTDGTALQFFCEGQEGSAPEVMQALRELFGQFGLADLLPRLFTRVTDLTPDEWAVFLVMRAALHGNDLLLLDEPTAGLQAHEAEPVVEIIGRLARDRAVVVITHHLQQARAVAHRVLLLGDGRVLEDACADAFFLQPRSQAGLHWLQYGTVPEQGATARESTDTQALVERAIVQLTADRTPGAGRLHPLLPARFRWVVPDRLAGVSIPGLLADQRQDLAGLRGAGIDTLLNLTEVPFNAAMAAEFGIQCLFEPIADMAPPTTAQAFDVCERLDAQLAAGRCIAVHCKAGQGRTGTVLAAYMMWRTKGQWSGVQAVRAMRRIDPGWIQSAAQVAFLSEFEQFIQRNVTFT